jgi:hypothetical protein
MRSETQLGYYEISNIKQVPYGWTAQNVIVIYLYSSDVMKTT